MNGRLVAALLLAVSFLAGGLPASAQLGGPDEAKLEPVTNVPNGVTRGIWIHEGYAYVTAKERFAIFDVHDPESPVLLSTIGMESRDVDLLEVDGRIILGISDDRNRIFIVDATDPYAPFVTKTVPLAGNSHNLVALPGTTLFYNSRAYYPSGIDILDVADPDNPVVVKVWNGGFPCHDITAYPDVGRAYCANAWGATYVLDITDPLNPDILLKIENPDISIHHWAVPSPDHKYLVIGDEEYSYPNGCVESRTTAVGTISASSGAVWFYDIGTAESLGQPMTAIEIGAVSMPEQQGGPCTSHFGQMIEGTGLMAVGWYRAGVALIDYDGPGLPRIVDQYRQDDSYTWDVRHADGYLFLGDSWRGLEVLELDVPRAQQVGTV